MEKHIPFEEAANKLMCRLEEKGYSDSYIKFSYEIDLHKLKEYLVKTSSMTTPGFKNIITDNKKLSWA